MSTVPYPDPKPWRCVLCGDRFATPNASSAHQTEYRPRSAPEEKTA